MDALPSVPEHAARGETAALYADIRTTLGVPATNLVWRHLAALDGALALVWAGVRPLYRSGALEPAAARLRALAKVDGVGPFSAATLRAAGVDDDALATLDRVLANYDASNPRNLVALMAVGARLRGEPAAGTPAGEPAGAERPPAGTAPLPPLLEERALAPAVRDAARRLEALGTGHAPRPVVGGVPRHLAHWPGFLDLCVRALEPREAALGQAAADVQQAARDAGRALGLELVPPPDPALRERVLAAIERFTARDLIANYIPKVTTLRAALGVPRAG